MHKKKTIPSLNLYKNKKLKDHNLETINQSVDRIVRRASNVIMPDRFSNGT